MRIQIHNPGAKYKAQIPFLTDSKSSQVSFPQSTLGRNNFPVFYTVKLSNQLHEWNGKMFQVLQSKINL